MSEPTWVPCIKRQEITRMEKDGRTNPIRRCAHFSCARFNTELKPGDCAACPVRLITHGIRPDGYSERPIYNREYGEPRIDPDGSLVYGKKVGLKPPLVPEGYAKTDDAWVFKPLFIACADREAANIVQQCGCIQPSAMCASKESKMYGLKIMPPACEACPVRRVAPSPSVQPDPS